MEYRNLGGTGLRVSALGFGCGAIGGLLVKGDRRDMERTIARAIELGINYFDTAPLYGDGKSETNLGDVLAALRANVLVGTKVRLSIDEMDDIEGAVTTSVETSLERLRRDRIDLIQLHNLVALERQPERDCVNDDEVGAIVEAFSRLQQQGKVRNWGINGLGDTEALHRVIRSAGAQTIQCCYSLLNPSAGLAVSDRFPFQDYELLIDRSAENQMGVIAIRVLAGGALSGSTTRHVNASRSVDPIATSTTYAEDAQLTHSYDFLVQEGYVSCLVEGAIRFVIGKEGISTVLVGISNQEQLEQAVIFANCGPLPGEALDRLKTVWASQLRK